MELYLIALGLLILVTDSLSREIEIETITPNPVTDIIEYGTIRVTRVKRNHFTISGNFAVKKNAGNGKQLIFEVVTEKGVTLMKKETMVCDFLHKDKLIYPDLVKVSNLPENPPCPFPKGNYTINNYEIDEKKFAAAPPGKYIAKMRLIEENELLTECQVKVMLSV